MRMILIIYFFFLGMEAGAQVCYAKPCKVGLPAQDSIQKQDPFFKPKWLDTVIVSSTYCPRKISCGTTCRSVRTKKDPLVKTLERTVKLNTQTEFKTYPNPVSLGKPVTVFMQAEQTGPHIVVVNNAAGLLVFKKPVQLKPGQQSIDLQTDSRWSRGMYFIRVMNEKGLQIVVSSFIAG